MIKKNVSFIFSLLLFTSGNTHTAEISRTKKPAPQSPKHLAVPTEPITTPHAAGGVAPTIVVTPPPLPGEIVPDQKQSRDLQKQPSTSSIQGAEEDNDESDEKEKKQAEADRPSPLTSQSQAREVQPRHSTSGESRSIQKGYKRRQAFLKEQRKGKKQQSIQELKDTCIKMLHKPSKNIIETAKSLGETVEIFVQKMCFDEYDVIVNKHGEKQDKEDILDKNELWKQIEQEAQRRRSGEDKCCIIQ